MNHPSLTGLRERIEAREADWRAGAVVYQVFVDRFAPSADLGAKRDLYPAPKTLRAWHETPEKGHFVESAGVWSHEIDFWGGDLASVRGKLGHLNDIAADVLYLNPVHLAYTNHKYDAADYLEVSPEYGSRGDLRLLVGDVLMSSSFVAYIAPFSRQFRDSLVDEKWKPDMLARVKLFPRDGGAAGGRPRRGHGCAHQWSPSLNEVIVGSVRTAKADTIMPLT